jgi:cell division protein FtsB
MTQNQRINIGMISLIVTLLINFAAGVWFAANLDARMSSLEKVVARREKHAELLGKISVRLENMERDIQEMREDIRGRK